MIRTDVAILGAGQAGLAMGRCLAMHGIDHVLIERGQVAERWRSAAWDSLRLLTPNWMTRLPGHAYRGPDPGGFMDRAGVVAMLEDYARAGAAPVASGATVLRVATCAGGYRVETDRGAWVARAVVIATGACDRPAVPFWASRLDPQVLAIHASAYRRPSALPPGGVLVVGASASGAQLARELRGSGRAVTLAVGRHVSLPRRYRGREIMEWLDAAGVLDEAWTAVPNVAAARAQPSMQLTGGGGDLDLGLLAAEGVRLVGRARGGDGRRLALEANLADEVAAAVRRRRRLLARIDAHVARTGEAAPADPSALRAPAVPACGAAVIDLRAEEIGTVIFATGYRRDYGWLAVPVLDAAGEIAHDGGVTAAAGLYVLGLRFLRRRSSNFIDGVGRDAEALSAHLAAHLGARRLAA